MLLKELLGKYFWFYYMDLEINWRELQACLVFLPREKVSFNWAMYFSVSVYNTAPFAMLSTLCTWLRAIKLKFDALVELAESCLT